MKKQLKKNSQKICDADQLIKLKEVKQKLQNFLIIHYLKKKGYASQYTILYKSYMIITAFTMTIILNFLFQEADSKKINNKMFLNQQDNQISFNYFFYLVPLNGKYSIVFVQLMILTTIQIIYESAINIYDKFNLKRVTTSKSKQKKQNNSTGQKMEQPDSTNNFEEEDNFKNLISNNSNQKQSNIYKQVKQLKRISDSLGPTIQKPPMKFIYLISVLFMESIIWEGILIKKWHKKKIHLIFCCCCLAQFLLWILINSTLKSQQKDVLSDSSKILFNGYYMFGIK